MKRITVLQIFNAVSAAHKKREKSTVEQVAAELKEQNGTDFPIEKVRAILEKRRYVAVEL